jgi:hypothetical protein
MQSRHSRVTIQGIGFLSSRLFNDLGAPPEGANRAARVLLHSRDSTEHSWPARRCL